MFEVLSLIETSKRIGLTYFQLDAMIRQHRVQAPRKPIGGSYRFYVEEDLPALKAVAKQFKSRKP